MLVDIEVDCLASRDSFARICYVVAEVCAWARCHRSSSHRCLLLIVPLCTVSFLIATGAASNRDATTITILLPAAFCRL